MFLNYFVMKLIKKHYTKLYESNYLKKKKKIYLKNIYTQLEDLKTLLQNISYIWWWHYGYFFPFKFSWSC